MRTGVDSDWEAVETFLLSPRGRRIRQALVGGYLATLLVSASVTIYAFFFATSPAEALSVGVIAAYAVSFCLFLPYLLLALVIETRAEPIRAALISLWARMRHVLAVFVLLLTLTMSYNLYRYLDRLPEGASPRDAWWYWLAIAVLACSVIAPGRPRSAVPRSAVVVAVLTMVATLILMLLAEQAYQHPGEAIVARRDRDQ